MPIQLILLGTVVLANIFLALFVFFQNPRSWVNRSFAIFAGTLSLWTICITMLNLQKTMFWSDATLLFGNVIGVGSFLMFAKHFPDNSVVNRRSLTYFFVLPILIFFVLLPVRPFVSGIKIENGQIAPILGPLYPVLMLWSIFGGVFGIYTIFQKYRKSRGLPRTQLKYLFSGFVVFLLFVTVTGVILPALGIASLGFISPVASLIMIAVISYSMVKHQLMDISYLVARSVAYTIVVAIFAFIYSLLLFLGGQVLLIEPISTGGLALSIVLSLALASSFQPLSRIIGNLTDKVFFRGYYDSNKLLYETSVIMASTLLLEDIVHLALQKILFEVKILNGVFILVEEGKIYLVGKEGKNDESLQYDEQKLQHLLRDKKLVDVNTVSNTEIKSIMKHYGFEVIVTMFQEGKHIGWICLGPKLSGEMFTTKDYNVLEILAPQIAVAIQNAKAYEEIRRFNITLEDEVDRATKELLVANEKLKELDKLKDEFVSVASHELRTPMTAIKSYLWMALQGKGGDLTEKQKYYLDRAYSSTDRLIRLVNEMLNISRIESGRVALQVRKVPILGLLKEVVAEVQPRAEELKIDIHLSKTVKDDKGEKVESPVVVADIDKVKELVINLVGNSLKFVSKGGNIWISVAQLKSDEITVTVKDDGVGIAPNFIPVLFQKFGLIKDSYQTNQDVSQGTGLGLYISKSIIELHGGKIWAESEGKGKGATFSFTLPIYSEKKMKEFSKKFGEVKDAGIIRNTV